MIYTLNFENIESHKAVYSQNRHFAEVIYPRLVILNNVRNSLKEHSDLTWEYSYEPDQNHNNFCAVRFREQNEFFHMQYSIPLFQKFQLNLFFGRDTESFFSAYQMLVEKGIIQKNEYPVSVGLKSLPSLIINRNVVGYNETTLNEIRNGNHKIVDPAVKRIIKESFDLYNSSLLKIIRHKWPILEGGLI